MGQMKAYTVKSRVNLHPPSGFAGYKFYIISEPTLGYYGRSTDRHILTHEDLSNNQAIMIDDDYELIPIDSGTSIYQGVKTHVYRPEKALSKDFTVAARIPPKQPTEEFSTRVIDCSVYNLYQCERSGGAYNSDFRKIFSRHTYFKGEGIPASELVPLVRKYPSEKPEYYVHIRDEKAYQKRLWDAVKSVCG